MHVHALVGIGVVICRRGVSLLLLKSRVAVREGMVARRESRVANHGGAGRGLSLVFPIKQYNRLRLPYQVKCVVSPIMKLMEVTTLSGRLALISGFDKREIQLADPCTRVRFASIHSHNEALLFHTRIITTWQSKMSIGFGVPNPAHIRAEGNLFCCRCFVACTLAELPPHELNYTCAALPCSARRLE